MPLSTDLLVGGEALVALLRRVQVRCGSRSALEGAGYW